MIEDKKTYKFERLRTNDTIMFNLAMMSKDKTIKNDYDKARNDYLKAIKNKDKRVKEYKVKELFIRPIFFSYRSIGEKFVNMPITSSVFNAVDNLYNLLEQNCIGVDRGNLLFSKPAPTRVNVAFFYDWEIESFKGKLMKFEELNIEWFSNSDVLGKAKFDRLINDYKFRSKKVVKGIIGINIPKS